MATARAAKARRHTMILSNVSTYSVEDVAKTLGTPPWQQLYMPLKWDDTEKMVKRIEGYWLELNQPPPNCLAGAPGLSPAAARLQELV